MQKLEIKGGRKISGIITISGSKNATLPILASTILTNKKVIVKNVPLVKDVLTMAELLSTIGSTVKLDKKRKKIEIENKKPLKTFAPYHLLKTMRAGVLVLGPLLTKYRVAKVSLPGGCAIGTRPINFHLDALTKMGAKIKIKDGYIYASAKNGLKGCVIKFPKISVGATENTLIAACFAKGETKLRNCAAEPEINDLILFLKKLGCKIKQIGKRSINVLGVNELKSTTHSVIFDRIETGTYIIAAALTKGNLKIMVDAGCRLHFDQAIYLCEAMREINCFFLEEPIPRDYKQYCKLKENSKIPLAGGESLVSELQFMPWIENNALDYLQPDANLAGINEIIKIDKLALANKLQIVLHNWTNAINCAANVHLGAALKSCKLIETNLTYNPLKSNLLVDDIVLKNGEFLLSEKPGLGVELNESALHKYSFNANL